jgi:tetratricopeptide (TPR) repeat protein
VEIDADAVTDVAPGVSWGLGWASNTIRRARRWRILRDNSDSGFTAFTLLNVERQCGLVYFANSANGLSIVRDCEHNPRAHAGLALLDYELRAPSAVARKRIAARLRNGGIDAALAEYRRIQEGQPAATPEKLLNDLGYSLLNQARFKDAIRAFRQNIAAYPTSANVYDSMGDAYLADGHPTAARDAYRRATELRLHQLPRAASPTGLNARLRH